MAFFEKLERAYHSANPILTHVYQGERSLAERYDYLDTFYFDDMATLAKHIASSVRKNRKEETKEENKRHWIVFVRKFEDVPQWDSLILQLFLYRALNHEMSNKLIKTESLGYVIQKLSRVFTEIDTKFGKYLLALAKTMKKVYTVKG